MMIEMPLYEVRYNDSSGWKQISEIDLMQKLHETYDRVTPAIVQMLEGNHIRTPEAVYRIKGCTSFSVKGFDIGQMPEENL